MSYSINCPHCGGILEIEERFEQYERIVAEITGGTRTPPNTVAVDVIGADRTTYQVKHSISNGAMGDNWRVDVKIPSGEIGMADFVVLFGVVKDVESMFLIPYPSLKRYGQRRRFRSNGSHEMAFSISTGNRSWVWGFYTTCESFLRRVAEWKSIEQLALQMTAGLE